MATFRDIRNCKGDLDKLQGNVETIECENDIKRRWKLRFIWRNQIIYPTEEEMKDAKGDMNDLVEICREREAKERLNNFQSRNLERKEEKNINKEGGYQEQTNSSFRRDFREKQSSSSQQRL